MSNLYEQSGVNLSEAHKLNKKLGETLQLNAFAGIAKSPVLEGFSLVTCCDGIGSKIIPLYSKKYYNTIAIDLIAANLNDLICSGATAVGFVDYIAVNKLDSEAVAEIIKELSIELNKYSCKLLGGETSEISELIKKDKIDVSGFAVGLAKESDALSKENVEAGDVVVGLCSSGIHANGFSLIRKLYAENKLTDAEFEACLAPSYVYYNCVSKLIKAKKIKACANITGGGILSNLSRSIPDGLSAKLEFDKIPPQPIFSKLKNISGDEFYDVFNAGVGFCLIAGKENLAEIFDACKDFSPFVLGIIENEMNIQN